jgi:hypothetical protein
MVDARHLFGNEHFEVINAQEAAVNFGSDGKAGRYGNTHGGKVLDHFAERCAFAANELNVLDAGLFQGQYEGRSLHEKVV